MSRREGLLGLARAALPPLLSAVVLIGLLSAWVATGGAGTLRRDQVQILLAAIPVKYQAGPITLDTAATYLAIKNLGRPDTLLSARSPVAAQVELVRDGRPRQQLRRLAFVPVAGDATTDLSPFGTDVVLVHPAVLRIGETVPLTLVFRRAGRIRVDLTVTDSLAVPGA
jgi:copper(I)-binding protein